MPRFQDSVGLLELAGNGIGSAWMVAPELALTALHCFGGAQNPIAIRIKFGATRHDAVIVDSDAALDVALLRVVPNDVMPLPVPLLACPAADPSVPPRWKAHGFPAAIWSEERSAG